jgi:hypothetical protein
MVKIIAKDSFGAFSRFKQKNFRLVLRHVQKDEKKSYWNCPTERPESFDPHR